MREYSPRRRTALVLAGSGTAGAYHAGVLKALDESGVKLDLVVGSGVGAVAAAFGAAAGGSRLYGERGFWADVSWDAFFRLRPARAHRDPAPGLLVRRLPAARRAGPDRGPPLPARADLGPRLARVGGARGRGAPGRALGAAARRTWPRSRCPSSSCARPASSACCASGSRSGAAWPRASSGSSIRARPAGGCSTRSGRSRAAPPSRAPPSEAELGRKYVSLLAENLGQPGFRELILRTADLETGGPLPFVVLDDAHRVGVRRGAGPRPALAPRGSARRGGPAGPRLRRAALRRRDDRPPGRRAWRPCAACRSRRAGSSAGETHRLTDAEAGRRLRPRGGDRGGRGADPPRHRGARGAAAAARAGGARARWPTACSPTLERQAVEVDLRATERINRMVETLGHRTGRRRARLAGPGDRPHLPLGRRST